MSQLMQQLVLKQESLATAGFGAEHSVVVTIPAFEHSAKEALTKLGEDYSLLERRLQTLVGAEQMCDYLIQGRDMLNQVRAGQQHTPALCLSNADSVAFHLTATNWKAHRIALSWRTLDTQDVFVRTVTSASAAVPRVRQAINKPRSAGRPLAAVQAAMRRLRIRAAAATDDL